MQPAPTDEKPVSANKKTIALRLNVLPFDSVIPLLARVDFATTLQLAQAIAKPEASVLAQIAACRGALTTPSDARAKATPTPRK